MSVYLDRVEVPLEIDLQPGTYAQCAAGAGLAPMFWGWIACPLCGDTRILHRERFVVYDDGGVLPRVRCDGCPFDDFVRLRDWRPL